MKIAVVLLALGIVFIWLVGVPGLSGDGCTDFPSDLGEVSYSTTDTSLWPLGTRCTYWDAQGDKVVETEVPWFAWACWLAVVLLSVGIVRIAVRRSQADPDG